MIASVQPPSMSPNQYLIWEAQQPIKYEFLQGDVYAMTGGTLAHNAIAVNLVALLRSHLRGKGCKVFVNDVKVQVSSEGPYFYPDLVVTCDPRDRPSQSIVCHPCLLIEVLSPTTERFDRGEKFRHYRKLSSLQEYVLVNAESMGVEVYRLNQRQRWELDAYFPEENARVEFSSIEFACAIADLYEEIEFGSVEAMAADEGTGL